MDRTIEIAIYNLIGAISPLDPRTTNLRNLETAIASALASARREALGMGADIADEWAAHYAEDIFSPEDTSLDCKAAGHGRHVARGIAEDLRKLASPSPTPAAGPGKCETCGHPSHEPWGCHEQVTDCTVHDFYGTRELKRKCACHGTGQSPAKGAP